MNKKGVERMNQKKTHRMGFGCILFGVLFLWNPIVGFVDVLPDFFGYLLLFIGTYRLADLNPHIEEARSKLRVLLWVGAGQLFAMWFLYSVMGNASEINRYEQPTGILLCSFALLFFKWYFLIAAFRDFFLGMERLAEKYDSSRIDVQKHGKTKSSRMINPSRFFIIVSTIASFLPEVSILASMEYEVQNKDFTFDWYNFIDMFRVIGTAIGLIVGLIWLVQMLRYLICAFCDKEWQERLHLGYSYEIRQKPGILTVRAFSLFVLLLQIAIVFSVNLRLSFYSALPGVGLALFGCLAVWLLSKKVRVGQKDRIYAVGGLLAVVSLAQCITNYLYLSQYLPEASLYQSVPYQKYLFVRILGMAEAVCTFLFIWVLMRFLMELVYQYTSVEYEGDVTHALSNTATARLHRSFERRGIVIFIFFLLASLGNLFESYFLLQYPWAWFICFLFSFVGIWNFFSMLHEFLVQIRFRYQLEPMNKKH